jgi:hypothetical protein
MKIRVIPPFIKHETTKQNEALERQLEQKGVERLQRRLATKLKLMKHSPVASPRAA